MELQLKNFTGLPVYFKAEKHENGKLINYANTEVGKIGDTLLIARDQFEILEIKEERPCTLDYGQTEPLIFQSAVCRIIEIIEKYN